MTFQKGRRRKSTRFGIWSTWLMFCNLSLKKMRTQKKTAGVSRREVYGILTAQYAGHGCYMQGVFWAFRWQFGFRRLVPAGSELSFGGAAAPIQPTYHTLIRIFGSNGTSHTGHTKFLQPILHQWFFCIDSRIDVIIQFWCLFLKLGLIGRIWSTSEAVATSPPLAFRETN